MANSLKSKRAEAGQSLVEYVVLMTIVIGMAKILFNGVPRILKSMERPFKDQFARAYKYGRPDACGFEGDPPSCGGSPEKHPKANGRMFARGKST